LDCKNPKKDDTRDHNESAQAPSTATTCHDHNNKTKDKKDTKRTKKIIIKKPQQKRREHRDIAVDTPLRENWSRNHVQYAQQAEEKTELS